jgi:hypothetical protein
VRYSDQKALIAIETLALLRGSLSPRILGMVTEWAALHRAELGEDWNLARAETQLDLAPRLSFRGVLNRSATPLTSLRSASIRNWVP